MPRIARWRACHFGRLSGIPTLIASSFAASRASPKRGSLEIAIRVSGAWHPRRAEPTSRRDGRRSSGCRRRGSEHGRGSANPRLDRVGGGICDLSICDLRSPAACAVSASDDLMALEAEIQGALATGDASHLEVVGYGEITLVVKWVVAGRPSACKRLPGLAGEAAFAAYREGVAEYIARLAGRGVVVPDTAVEPVRRPDGSVTAYCVQPVLAADTLLTNRLHAAGPGEVRRGVRPAREADRRLHRPPARPRRPALQLGAGRRASCATSTSRRRSCATRAAARPSTSSSTWRRCRGRCAAASGGSRSPPFSTSTTTCAVR